MPLLQVSPVLLRIVALLLARNETLSVAESCTGGRLSTMATAITGSSQWFAGGVVSYSMLAKEKLLAIPPKLIAENGVVSRKVAIAMAEGIASKLNSNMAIATTGLAGPLGGTAEISVGTIWIAICYNDLSYARKLSLRGGRTSILAEATHEAYSFAWQCLISSSNTSTQNNQRNNIKNTR